MDIVFTTNCARGRLRIKFPSLRLHYTFCGTGLIFNMRLRYYACGQQNYYLRWRKDEEIGLDPGFETVDVYGPTPPPPNPPNPPPKKKAWVISKNRIRVLYTGKNVKPVLFSWRVPTQFCCRVNGLERQWISETCTSESMRPRNTMFSSLQIDFDELIGK